jgi:uncharacterized protein (DUF2344 family)
MFVRYFSKSSKYTVGVTLKDGRGAIIDFIGRDSITKDRFVDISDPLIIEALESHNSFDVNFYRKCELDDNTTEAIVSGEVLITGEAKEEIKEETPEKIEIKEESEYILPEEIKEEVKEYEIIDSANELIEEINEELEEIKTPSLRVFPTAIEAKKWINVNHSVPYSRMKTADQLTAEFKKIGFELNFEYKNK